MRLSDDLATSEGRAGMLLAMVRRRTRFSSAGEERAPTWTLPVPDLRRILRGPFAVTGGVATRLFMSERLTDDLDVLLPPSERDGAEGALRVAGAAYQGAHPAGGSRWRLPPDFPSDLPGLSPAWRALQAIVADTYDPPASEGAWVDLLTLDAAWVPAALAQAIRGPTGLPVLALPYLILMKLTSATLDDLADLGRMVARADPHRWQESERIVGDHAPARLDLLAEVYRTAAPHITPAPTAYDARS
ncbi:MAG TPA: hypothetical protein VMW49_01035 [Candidatus Dormibacteraeota bacterium]|nr:hypothetical protein [Candidatus Dormibacteraeota bacterium]HVB09141.1 hypothetical protein [Bacillota bacterium]